MLLIKDLAERWGVSVAQAKRIVRDEKVPFIALRHSDMRVHWTFVRFEPETVAAWERSRERTASDDRPAPPARVTFRLTK